MVKKTFLLAILTKTVARVISSQNLKVYITTVTLKHLYDKRPAEEFDVIIRCLHQVVRYPKELYENKPGKRGQFCFIKKIRGEKYFCSIERSEEKDDPDGETEKFYAASAFRLRDENYLKGYKLVWSWKDDTPSS